MKKVVLLISLFMIIILRIFYLNIYEKGKYEALLVSKTKNYVYGDDAPRGRILDHNGIVLVDNVGVKTLYYIKEKNVKVEDEIIIAEYLSSILDIDSTSSISVLKKYWLVNNDNGTDLITSEELELYNKRKLSSDDILNLKYERITDEMLESINIYAATIYDLMNKGYSYSKKIIKEDLSDLEYTNVVESNINSLTTGLTWQRVYNYGDTLKDIFGTIGNIPLENKDEYLSKGYSLEDTVGLSYLEYEYEDILKGEKDLYRVNSDNTLTLVKKGHNGSDLVLSIDIEAQLELEKTIEKNIINAKKYQNTDYFSETYSIVGNPNTGEIIALSGRKLVDIESKTFKNVNTNLINTSYTVGSIVKMATISTGYKYGIINIGTQMKDGCIKLYQVPLKCSYKDLGVVNDLTAISKSSNYYQFKIAIGLTNNTYNYNMKLDTSLNDFNKFRGVFKEYGLGSITGIDLPNEEVGITGKNVSSDLLLNLSIGQYDTYTPVELFQYVNTIASLGNKKSPQLMKKVVSESKVMLENDYKINSVVDLDEVYLKRIKEAMHLSTVSGTSRNYINSKYNPAGKTGTSETFIDTDNDNIMDTKTISIGFVGFAPYDNPMYSIIVLAPNLYVDREEEYSKVYVTRYISQDITNFLFENQ